MMTLKRDNVVKVVADDNDAAKLKAKGFVEKSPTGVDARPVPAKQQAPTPKRATKK